MRDGGKNSLSLVTSGEDVTFYLGRVPQAGARLLVLGAVHQPLIWGLAAHGSPVVALDPSAAVIEAAERRRADQPAEISQRTQLLRMDLRAARLSERFEAAFAPLNVLGLLGSAADLDAVLAMVGQHLVPQGLFAFDLKPASQESGGPLAELGQGPPRGLEPKRPLFAPHLRERRANPAQPGPIRRLSFRPLPAGALEQALRANGFRALERWGGFGSSPYEPGDPIQVVVAQRG